MRLNKPALSPDIDLFHNRLDSVIDRGMNFAARRI